MPPEPELFAAVLPDLLSAIELQRDAGDLARPPWPAWLTDTIEAGGEGYCLHATMRQADDTAALLDRVQALARRNQRGDPAAVHETAGRPSSVNAVSKALSLLFLTDDAPRYALVAAAGGWLLLTDAERWSEGR